MTGDAEFRAVEQFVGECVGRIEGTPYLRRGMALVFLEELANNHARYDFRAMAVPTVTALQQLDWPPEMTKEDRCAALVALLTDSGIATVANDVFRFASEAVCHYLRAKHIFRRHTDGPSRWLFRTLRHLRTRPEWSEQDKEIARFLVILWWPDARPAVVRQLGTFLKARHRDPNIFFIAELCERGLLAGSDLCDRTIAILRDEVGAAKRSDDAWQKMAESLHALDPAAAGTELRKVVQSRKPAVTLSRQLMAVLQLRKFDPVLGAANLEYLADHLWGDPDEQIAVAVRIAGLDPNCGARALVSRARDPGIGDARVEAALHVDAPLLWGELLQDPALSDRVRLRLMAHLLERDPDQALALVLTFAASVDEEKTPLRIAELIKGHDSRLAGQVAYDVAWTTERQVDSWVRLAGVRLLGTLEPSQAMKMLGHFSAWSAVDGEVRLRAATIVMEEGNPPTALLDLARAQDVAVPYRLEAVAKLSAPYPDLGAAVYIEFATACGRTEQARLDLLRAAYALAAGPATEALAAVADEPYFPDEIRIEAVEIAHSTLTRARRIELYCTISQTADHYETAIAVARRVKAMDPDKGMRLMAVVADQIPVESRVQLAIEAGRHGEHVLKGLVHRLCPAHVRFDAAFALARFDQMASDRTMEELAGSSGAGEVRIRAALALPEPKVLWCLVGIVGDGRETDEVRRDAGVAAMQRDEDTGRKALAGLAESRVSTHIREQIAWLLQQ